MIVSDKFRYVFVELPHTGTTAISAELCLNYDGREVLHKHATYKEFLANATQDQRRYFVFSCIRHPLDDAVTYYFKYKNALNIGFDIDGNASLRYPRDLVRRMLFGYRYRRHLFVTREQVGFEDFFLKYYRLPYDNWSSLSHHRFDYLLHFERLGKDFLEVLQKMDIQPIRELPVVHKTRERDADFRSYFTPRTYQRAAFVFGPYMKKWGYTFPAEWGEIPDSRSGMIMYRALSPARKFSWRYLRPLAYSAMLEQSRNLAPVLPAAEMN